VPAADLVCPDGVDGMDYSFLAGRWMDENCEVNNNCDGVDLDFSGKVDFGDLRIFAERWIE
jgi:hypothetical protein